MYRKLGCNVLLVDYRGFGHSEGEPTETGLQLDAEAVLDAMHARDDIDSSKIFLFGRSLGGAVSVFLAEKRPHMISGLILENTFLSISSMVDTLMPWLSYVKPIVLRIDWSNERRIKKISHPILFVAGLQDELVPHSHMKQLRVLASASRRVEWHEVPYGTHNDSWLRGGESYYQALRKFIESVSNSKLDNETCDASSTSSDQVNTEASIPSMLQQPLFSTLNSKKNE
jgi:fermentation-respiration switch protein FrsA (DUF1100 family)